MRTLANWPLRAKLLAVLALPTAAAVALTAVQISSGVSEMSSYQRSVDAVQFDKQTAEVVDALQRERLAMATWIVDGRSPRHTELDARIAKTKNAWEQAKQVGADLDVASTALAMDTPRMAALSKLRDMVLKPKPGDPPMQTAASNAAYESVIDTLSKPTLAAGGAKLRDQQNALFALAEAKEDAAKQNMYLELGAQRGQFGESELRTLNEDGADLVAAIERFNQVAPDEAKRAYTGEMTGIEVNNQFQLQQLATQRADANQPVAIDANAVRANSKVINEKFGNVLDRLYASVGASAGAMLDNARLALIFTASVLVLALAVTLFLAFFIARTMLRQLRTLRGSALRVANEQLPATLDRILSDPDPRAASRAAISPVGVHTTEEIGQVARSFDEVHRQAVRLATEQALLRDNLNQILVNLSRRSQVLVQRQLGVVDRLEEREQDPDRLTDLFELDHLTTRLRRNSESLLVLSGSGPANQVTRPTRAEDIIGASVSETEDYRRVDVGTVPDVSVHGQAVHDLVHLLAELLDNAAFFSEQSTKVQVRAALTRGGVLAIQITDTGVGMTADQLAVANQQLLEPPDLDVSVTRRMGLYVVARLAKRHDIEVWLAENEDIEGGVVARVKVPNKLLTDKNLANSGLPPQVSVRQMAKQVNGTNGTRVQRPQESGDLESVPTQREESQDSMGLVIPPDLPGTAAASSQRSYEQPELPALEAPLSLDSLGDGPIVTDQPSTVAEDGGPAATNGSGPSENGNGSNGHAGNELVANGQIEFADGEQGKQSSGGGQNRHDELVRKGAPIYQEMLSRWLTDSTDTDVFAAVDESGRPNVEWREGPDAGWHAAASLSEVDASRQQPGGALPKRVPNAYLVPGSVSSESAASEQSGKHTERSADEARTRMTRFQSGFQAGRKALGRPAHAAEEPARDQDAGEREAAGEQTNPFGLTDKE